MRTLYGSPLSRAFRCVWMLEELGLDYENVPTDWRGDATRTPEFLAINPNAKIPVLVDGEIVVWESLAINLYLARHCGGAGSAAAMPPLETNAEVGLAYRWSFWAMGEFEGPIDAAARYDARLPAEWGSSALGVLEEALSDSDSSWLAGPRFGVADLNVAVMFQRPLLAEVDRRPFPAVHAWLKRCRARPAFQRMIAIGQAAA